MISSAHTLGHYNAQNSRCSPLSTWHSRCMGYSKHQQLNKGTLYSCVFRIKELTRDSDTARAVTTLSEEQGEGGDLNAGPPACWERQPGRRDCYPRSRGRKRKWQGLSFLPPTCHLHLILEPAPPPPLICESNPGQEVPRTQPLGAQSR